MTLIRKDPKRFLYKKKKKKKGNKNNTVQQLCVTEKWQLLNWVLLEQWLQRKSSRLRCICCVVRGNMETTDGSNPTSRLLLEHIDSVFIFHFQLLRE